MHIDSSGQAVSSACQHCWPEQRMEIYDVLADKMIQLGVGAGLPISVEIIAAPLAEVFKARHISDWRIEPDVEKLARRAGYLETEVGRIATDVPLLEFFVEPLCELIGYRILQRTALRVQVRSISLN